MKRNFCHMQLNSSPSWSRRQAQQQVAIRPAIGRTSITAILLTIYTGWKQCGNVQVARTKDRMRYFKRSCVTAKSASYSHALHYSIIVM